MMLQETKREVCDRRFVGSLRATRNKAWASLYACKASKGVLIIWNTKKLSSEEVVIGFFSISIKFLMDDLGSSDCPRFLVLTISFLGRIFGWSSWIFLV